MKAKKAVKTTQAIKKEAEKKKQVTKEWLDWSDDDVNTHLMDFYQFDEEEMEKKRMELPRHYLMEKRKSTVLRSKELNVVWVLQS